MSLREETDALNRFFEDAVARKDLDALNSGFYAPNAQLLAPGAPIASGPNAIKATLQALVDMGADRVALDDHTVEASGDLVYSVGQYRLAFTNGASDQGKYVVVFRRQPDGSLRAVADIFNSNTPAG